MGKTSSLNRVGHSCSERPF